MILIYFAIANELLMMTGVAIYEKKESEWISQDKPIIYIYPKEELNVKIKVSDPKKLTISYPKYNDGWQVKALTDGTLIAKDNKKYYALYWEGQGKDNKLKEDGFVVKGEDTANFLEEKLELLGLNYKESNEFIMYWLPKLENNKYNYIRFMTKEEIDNNMKLIINPEPDTLIRVMMEYKGLDKKIKVKEEKLTKVVRKGYTVVEWGGTEIKQLYNYEKKSKREKNRIKRYMDISININRLSYSSYSYHIIRSILWCNRNNTIYILCYYSSNEPKIQSINNNITIWNTYDHLLCYSVQSKKLHRLWCRWFRL